MTSVRTPSVGQGLRQGLRHAGLLGVVAAPVSLVSLAVSLASLATSIGCGGPPGLALALAPSSLAPSKAPPDVAFPNDPVSISAAAALPAAAADTQAPASGGPPTGTTTVAATAPATHPAEARDPSLGVVDVMVGSGDTAAAGDRVTVHYTGTLTDGTVFDTSRKRSRPFDFTLGVGQVIKGWDQGVVGMKVGGLRKLTVPGSLGYGPRGQPPVIPADATLLFDVELIAVDHSTAGVALQPRTIVARHVLVQYMGSRTADAAIVRTRVQAKGVAEEVLRRAKAGDDFARLAVEFSDEPGAGSRGGSLGRFGHGKWVPEFDAAAFVLKPGEISSVVETPFGFHVIQRLE